MNALGLTVVSIAEAKTMSKQNEQQIIRIDLTDEQKAHVKGATEKNIDAIELTVQELEARIAPRLAANHNQTMLDDA